MINMRRGGGGQRTSEIFLERRGRARITTTPAGGASSRVVSHSPRASGDPTMHPIKWEPQVVLLCTWQTVAYWETRKTCKAPSQ